MGIYASYLMEYWREKRGLSPDDSSQDELIIEEQSKGKKLSKSDYVNEAFKSIIESE